MQKQHIFLTRPIISITRWRRSAHSSSMTMKKDCESAWARYLKLQSGARWGYFDLLHYVGIPVPFEDGAVEKACARIEEIESAGLLKNNYKAERIRESSDAVRHMLMC